MIKKTLFVLAGIFASSVYADIPYCSGTSVQGSKHNALQSVVRDFAKQYNCSIGSNCILNFNTVKYSIAWAKDCPDSARHGNDRKGSTFVCDAGVCQPLGFDFPSANY